MNSRAERQFVKKVLTKLEAHGYRVNVVSADGEHTHVANIKEAMNAATDVDTCQILCVRFPNEDYTNLLIVWGNSPNEVISDFGAPDKTILNRVSRIIR